jgi:mannosyltransferase
MLPARERVVPEQPAAPDEAPPAVDHVVTGNDRTPSRFAILLIAPAVMLALGAWGLARKGAYGVDEAATKWAALLPLHDLWRLLGHLDAVHGLYYLGMHAWLGATGHGAIELRLPSLIAAVLTAGVITELGRRLSGRTVVGVVAGLLYAISPFVTFYAQTARSYAIVSLVVAVATLMFVRALEAERDEAARSVVIRRWVGYAVLVALAGWLNEMALLMLTAHAATLLIARWPRRIRLHWLSAAVAAAVVVFPLFVISSSQHNAVEWIPKPTASSVYLLVRDLFGPDPVVMVITIGCALLACVPGGPRGWRARGPLSLVAIALPMLLVPPVVLIVESEIGSPLYVDRYLLYTVIGAVLLIAEGLGRIGWSVAWTPKGGWVWATGLVAVLLMAAIHIPTYRYIRTPDSRLRNFAAPSRFLAKHAQPGDGALFFSSFYRLSEMAYPQDFRDITDIAAAKTPKQSATFRGVDDTFSEAAPKILARNRIWVVGHDPFGPQAATVYDEERDLLVEAYRLKRFEHFQGVDVTLWVRKPPVPAARQPHGTGRTRYLP